MTVASAGKRLDRLLNGRFGLTVERACSLVEYEDIRTPNDSARNGQALPFAAGKSRALIVHDGVVAVAAAT